ncbi:hypothetical protein F7725_026604 [Dissostichus mawsoni]|uniref:CxC3 like cysteine cluster domain-containing protein n=1 Tax=Dissostichus mawsoni TaxID=36200 RepID=A0A7J5X8E5_DISMA|nr:hypothetical protein F7725_026604 [Dissostichus mawsoni]
MFVFLGITMSDSELQDVLKSLDVVEQEQEELNNELLKSLDDLVEQAEQEELNNELQGPDNLISKLRDEEAAAPVKTPEPIVKWKKRDVDGNQIFERPKASRNLPNQAGPSRRKAPRVDAPDTDCEMVFAPETVECFLQDLQLSLSDASGDELETSAPTAPLMASLDWGTRKSLFLERWKTERPRLINSTAAQENVANRICQQCGSNPAAVRCRDCRPHPFLCAECDVSMHTRHVLHNRDAMTAGFFQPLPPTTFVADKALSHCGRHDLSMPELSCHTCDATWAAGLDDLIQSGYWPATLHFSTIYETDVFYSFEEMKMAAPGLSCQAFLRMLDQRTFRFGRSGKISADNFQQSFFEWEAVRFEVENICKEESFICPACTPDMLAVSVDGNRKHYCFKHAARYSAMFLISVFNS